MPSLAVPRSRRLFLTKVLVGVAMVGAILVTALFVYWDEKREEEAAFDDLALEETRSAIEASETFGARLDGAQREADVLCAGHATLVHAPIVAELVRDAPETEAWQPPPRDAATFFVSCGDGTKWRVSLPLAGVLHDLARIQDAGEILLFLAPPGADTLVTSEGSLLRAPALSEALAGTSSSLRLTREQAAGVGLPARTAFAGLARVDAGAAGRWGVVVVASARRERARELRSRIRLIVSATFVGGVVFMLGNLAFRRMAKEMELERELSLAEVRQRGDERLGRASRAAVMGTLATGVAHEIATPLGIIVGRAEQVEKRVAGDERAERSVRTILEQVERINQVVRGFLNLARGAEPALARAPAQALVRSAVRLTQHRFEKAGVSISERAPDDVGEVQCDPRLFEHALVNLLLNACEACSKGGTVTISAETDGDHITFVVMDDGIGITDADAARALEPFFTTKPVGQGTGLGLAITNEIVKAHRGSLSIAPNTPRGTRATIEVPMAAPTEVHADALS